MIVSPAPKAARTSSTPRSPATCCSSRSRCSGCCRCRSRARASSSQLHPALIPHEPTLSNYRQALDAATASAADAALAQLQGRDADSAPDDRRRPACGIRARAPAGLDLEARARLDPAQPDVPADPDHHPALPAAPRPAPRRTRTTGLVFVYVVWTLPFILWMLQSYVRGIPRDLEEAAMVDGASRFKVLRTVIAPLLAPGHRRHGLFAFITAWNEFFLALVLLQTPEQDDAAAAPRAVRRRRGHRPARPTRRERAARDAPEPPAVHGHPALAHPRPALRER